LEQFWNITKLRFFLNTMVIMAIKRIVVLRHDAS
jgi:hypothetical protein